MAAVETLIGAIFKAFSPLAQYTVHTTVHRQTERQRQLERQTDIGKVQHYCPSMMLNFGNFSEEDKPNASYIYQKESKAGTVENNHSSSVNKNYLKWIRSHARLIPICIADIVVIRNFLKLLIQCLALSWKWEITFCVMTQSSLSDNYATINWWVSSSHQKSRRELSRAYR